MLSKSLWFDYDGFHLLVRPSLKVEHLLMGYRAHMILANVSKNPELLEFIVVKDRFSVGLHEVPFVTEIIEQLSSAEIFDTDLSWEVSNETRAESRHTQALRISDVNDIIQFHLIYSGNAI